MCKDACNCIERLFCKWNHISIPEQSGYSSRGMASFYFLTNLVQKYTLADCCTVCFSGKKNAASLCARGTAVGREGGGSACSQASWLLALSSSLFFLPRISATKRKKITTAPTRGSRKSFRCATRRKWPLSVLVGTAEPRQQATNTDPANRVTR